MLIRSAATIWMVAVSFWLCAISHAQSITSEPAVEPSTEQQDTPTNTVFTPASFKKHSKKWTSLAGHQKRNINEVWVLIALAVDREGNPFEIAVIDSMEDESIEKEAVRFGNSLRFNPALVNGTPSDTNLSLPYCQRVYIDGRNLSQIGNADFKEGYEKLTTALRQGDKAAAESALADLRATSLIEDAYLNYAKAKFHRRWGNPTQELIALSRATICNQDYKYLTADITNTLLKEKFFLQAETQQYGAALETHKTLDEHSKTDPDVVKIMSEMHALATDQRSYHVYGEIKPNGSWFYQLLKRGFRIETLTGSLTNIKLRCKMKFEILPYKDKKLYSVPEDYGACLVESIGTPGTKLILTELPPM